MGRSFKNRERESSWSLCIWYHMFGDDIECQLDSAVHSDEQCFSSLFFIIIIICHIHHSHVFLFVFLHNLFLSFFSFFSLTFLSHIPSHHTSSHVIQTSQECVTQHFHKLDIKIRRGKTKIFHKSNETAILNGKTHFLHLSNHFCFFRFAHFFNFFSALSSAS